MQRIFWWRVKEMELTGYHFRKTGNTGERKKSRDRKKGSKESPERPHLSCFTSAINPDSAKRTQPWHTNRLFHVMFSAYNTLPETSMACKGRIFSNGMWSFSGVPKPCWRGSCMNILQTSSYRKGEQTQELDALFEQQNSSGNIPKWNQTLKWTNFWLSQMTLSWSNTGWEQSGVAGEMFCVLRLLLSNFFLSGS